ncbi:MAG: DUF3574 domain-containing protein [Chloroflexota bacterium]|nr:DUF3574 domain-containing protein [Chloroflexota bacterium]
MRPHRWIAPALLALAALALLACGDDGEEPCPEGSDRYAEYQLFFGRSTADGSEVSDEQWAAFLADTVTPRFPAGLTVLDAAGQWRGDSGTVQRERSKVLWILAAPGEETLRLIDEISAEYERRFNQDSVLRIHGTACASFS